MYYIANDSNNPYYNLALEEYLLLKRSDLSDIFLLWQNSPTVVIGRHQNPCQEINPGYLEQEGISLVRRISGGGAVYHDAGNLNYTFITSHNQTGIDFARFTSPIIGYLNSIGILAENSGRNDIVINGKKISGNAQHIHRERILHHGTLIFAVDLEIMSKVLQVEPDKFKSSGVQSVRSRVTNISEYLSEPMTVTDFKTGILQFLDQSLHFNHFYLTLEDINEIRSLKVGKYDTWAWNYGKSPTYSRHNDKRFLWGKLAVDWEVKQGRIAALSWSGDFFNLGDIQELERKMIGVECSKPGITAALAGVDLSEYIEGLNIDIIIELLCT